MPTDSKSALGCCHDINAVWHTEDVPVRQVPKNSPRFPYLQQRLWRLSLRIDLSWRCALFPICQQHVYFSATPPTWGVSGFGCSIEQILAFFPWVIVRKPSSMS